MRKVLAGVLAVVVLGGASLALAGGGSKSSKGMKGMGNEGWGMGGAYHQMYNPRTVESITGDVVSVDYASPMKGMSAGVHVMVRTDKETLSVHLGPAWYIDNQDVRVAPNDHLDIKGSRVTFNGQPAIIAAEVRKGDQVLALRDEAGVPAWSGWRRR